MIFQQIIVGMLVAGLGVAGLKYNYQLVGLTGNVGFFERFLGGGGTYAGFKILAVVVVIGGLLYMTGLGTPVLHALLSPLAPYLSGFKQ